MVSIQLSNYNTSTLLPLSYNTLSINWHSQATGAHLGVWNPVVGDLTVEVDVLLHAGACHCELGGQRLGAQGTGGVAGVALADQHGRLFRPLVAVWVELKPHLAPHVSGVDVDARPRGHVPTLPQD